MDFVKRLILCRFGIPKKLVYDNETQFENEQLKKFCAKYGIQKSFATVVYPQSNEQVEAVNMSLKYMLKTKLKQAKGLWVERLPLVLWAYQTTKTSPTREMPFSLAYGAEAIVPIELAVATLRKESYDQD